MQTFLLVLDLAGTFVFALSGGAAGVTRRLDLFGVLVLSFVAGNVGGITRDLLIAAVPPAAISDWRYLAVSVLAGLVTFWWSPVVGRLRSPVLVFDGAGLALFAVRRAEGARLRTQSCDGGTARHADRDRWRRGTRHSRR